MSEIDSKIVITPSSPIRITPAETIQVTPSVSNPILIKPNEAVVIVPEHRPAITVSPNIAVTIKPPDRGAWDERGWSKRNENQSEIFEGFYQVNDKKRGQVLRFRGRIETTGQNHKEITAYILNPPPEIKKHAHGPCFQLIRDGWFYMHWSRPAKNADDAILYMEKVLDESLNG